MTSVQNPTYLLAADWTFRPGGCIALGNIVADPFRPDRVLSKPSEPFAETQEISAIQWECTIEKLRSINLSIWAKIFDPARGKLAAQKESTGTTSFTMKSLDTISFTDEPSLEEMTKRVKETRVFNVIKPGSLFSSPVYMITRLKIAKGFKLIHQGSAKAGISAEASGTLYPEASLGGKADAKAEMSHSEAFELGTDIIFAYQLLMIKHKGLGKDKRIDIDEFHNPAVFLEYNESEEEDEGVEVERHSVTTELLPTVGEKGITRDDLDDLCTWLSKGQE